MKSSPPGGHFVVFFGLSCSHFLYFLRTVQFLMKFCTYVLDNTLMVARLKNLWGYCHLLGAILSFAFLGGDGAYFQYCSLFLERGSVCFRAILQRYYCYYSGNYGKVPCSKPLGGSKVDSAFHPSEVDKMSTRNIWELSGKN